MAHPYGSKKGKNPDHSHRVNKLFGHHIKTGGAVIQGHHGDIKQIKNMLDEHERKEGLDMKPVAGKSKHRADKYARGGKVKHGKGHHTKINIIVAPKAGGDGAAPPMPPPGAGAAPPMPPKPPMAPPPGGPMAGPGPMAGGMPGIGAKPGGMKRGGKVAPKSGISSPSNLKEWSKYASSNTRYKDGGKVGMTAGAISGEGRKQKIKAYGMKRGK